MDLHLCLSCREDSIIYNLGDVEGFGIFATITDSADGFALPIYRRCICYVRISQEEQHTSYCLLLRLEGGVSNPNDDEVISGSYLGELHLRSSFLHLLKDTCHILEDGELC